MADNDGIQYREYSPDARFQDGYLGSLGHLLKEVLRFRSHIRTIFMQQFRNSYRGTKLGVFWNLVLPLLPVSVYVLLTSFRVVPQFEGLPPALAITFNATLWFLFSDCVRTPISIVKTRNATVMKTSLPLSVSIVAGFAQTIFDTLIRLGLVVVVAVLTMKAPALTLPLGILLIGLSAILFLALGLLLAILNVIYPDLERVVTIVLRYGIFLSGVIFPLSRLGPLGFLEWINPFAVVIAASRELVFNADLLHPWVLAIWLIGGLLVAFLAGRVFHVMEKRIRSVV
ncbi:MAG: ABC transporter permease [Methyloligella sp. ZOD6]